MAAPAAVVTPRVLLPVACAVALGLAGCGSTPKPAPTPSTTAPAGNSPALPPPQSYERDGALPNPPADLEQVPDAEPRVEPIKPGGANKPYEVEGQRYVPQASDAPLKERGLASWYGRKFHGRPTASGERYDMYAMTAAHPTMPLPSYARVTNVANGREVIVRINDRGPFYKGRVIDLSYTAALKLGLLRGVGIVEVERLSNEDIRTGAWKRGGPTATAVAAVAPAAAAAPAVAPSAVAAAVPVAAPAAAASVTASPAETAAPSSDATPPATAAGAFWLQLGAFRAKSGAESFQRKVAGAADGVAQVLAIVAEGGLHRLQAGPFASREAAGEAAERLRRAIDLVPVIVERSGKAAGPLDPALP